MSDLTVIVPALNEAATIKGVVESIRALPIEPEVLVVDNSSSDDTETLAREAGAQVINVVMRGKGVAVQEAFKYIKTPYVGMIDADDTYPVIAFLPLYAAMPNCDVAKGDRRYCAEGSMTLTHKFGNFMLSLIASILYGHRVHDVCSGMWVFRRECLDKFRITSRGFTLEADLFANTVLNNYKFYEAPIVYKSRLDGSQAKLKMLDGFKIGLFLIRRRLKGV